MAEDINITYKIEEDELICLESNDSNGDYIRWNNQKNMRYSIGDMPFNINFARLSEEFRVVDGTNVVIESSSYPAKIKIKNKIESTQLDNRIKNLVYYSWDKTFIDSSTVIETDLDGILVKGIKINDGESVRFGDEKKGCIYAAKSSLDKSYLTPLMTVNGLITIIKNNDDYKCYLLRSVDSVWSHWVELVVNKTVYFYCNMSGWSDNGTCYDTTKPDGYALCTNSTYSFSFDSPTCQAYYDSYYSITENGTEVQKSPATVQWSINSYDIDSENNLRNFLLDENGSQFVRNKYTNNEPITMCQAIPVDDVISENGQDVSSSNNCYILFDYQSNDTQQYALYSPELLETYGIGFIRSDWIIYDKDGNLRVEFWPEKASNLLFDKDGNKTLETPTGSYEHNAANPLYGCIKSFRTAKGVIEVGISETLVNEAIFVNTKENVRNLLQNRASICRCYKMFEFHPMSGGESSVLRNDKPLYIKTESTMIHYCKAEYNNDYSKYNDVTKSHVTKKDKQLAFRLAKLTNMGKVENDADEIQNLCVWFYNDTYKMPQLYYIDDYRSYNGAVTYATKVLTITGGSEEYEYYPPLGACASNVVPYMDEENQPLLQYERWKNVLQYIYAEYNRLIDVTGGQYFDPSQNGRTIFKGNAKVYTKISKYSPADENAEENVEKLLEEDGWMTPNDYYNTKVNTSNVDTGSLGYTRASSATDEIKGYWFWVDELKNWCIWRRTNRAFLHLYVWNGRNGWDKLEDIVNAWAKFDWQTLKRIYFYNPSVISYGVHSDNFSSMATTYKDGSTWKPALMAINSYHTIILKRDTSISTYDSETFQNIHSSSVMYVDKGNGHMGVTIPGDTTYGGNTTHIGKVKKDWGAIAMPVVGCPCVVRNTNGQLNLMYVNKLDGNFTINDDTNEALYFKDEGVRYLNSVCKTFFGNGDEFKIEDWKKFTKKDNTEERASKMYSSDDESLYGVPPLINSEAEKINMKMTMTSPRPNVGTKSVKNEDYILRWNR